jgi:membrane protein implicated in regulation of membrane protease activity
VQGAVAVAVAVVAVCVVLAVMYGMTGVWWAPLVLLAAFYVWALGRRRRDRREGLD